MSNQSEAESIGELVRQNLELTQELLKQMHSVRRYIFWQRMISIFYIIIIVGPIILGIFYLPPLLKDAIGSYQELLGENKTGGMDINSILNELQR